MKRRTFTKLTGLSAIAISTTGFIKFNGESYIGDCETTTDILVPFYRPDSPMRDNLVVEGIPGEMVELSGVVRHKDCTTPYKNAKIERVLKAYQSMPMLVVIPETIEQIEIREHNGYVLSEPVSIGIGLTSLVGIPATV